MTIQEAGTAYLGRIQSKNSEKEIRLTMQILLHQKYRAEISGELTSEISATISRLINACKDQLQVVRNVS